MSFSVYDEQEINVTMRDIIGNLGSFSTRELENLASELDSYVTMPISNSSTLYDEMKREALIELSEVMELDEINQLVKEKINR